MSYIQSRRAEKNIREKRREMDLMKLQVCLQGNFEAENDERQYEASRKDDTIITNFMFMIMVLC